MTSIIAITRKHWLLFFSKLKAFKQAAPILAETTELLITLVSCVTTFVRWIIPSQASEQWLQKIKFLLVEFWLATLWTLRFLILCFLVDKIRFGTDILFLMELRVSRLK